MSQPTAFVFPQKICIKHYICGFNSKYILHEIYRFLGIAA